MKAAVKISTLGFLMSIAALAMGKTVQVGECEPHLQSYSTISQAVSAVSPGSTILICPGTYPEQVTITQSLTLKGVQTGNAANPTITVPPGGLTQSVVLNNGATMFYQLLAQGSATDQVNIEDIAINGSGNHVGSNAGWLSGICYRAASGTISHTAIFNQKGNGYGWGVFLETNGPPSMSTVSVTANDIYDFDDEGIRSNANSTPPSLTVAIKNNAIVIDKSPTLYASAAAIDIDGVGVISGNTLLGSSSGIGIAFGSSLSVSNNAIENFLIAIWELGASNVIDDNRVSTTEAGIILSGDGNDVENNFVAGARGGSAISFNCTGTSNTVIHNTINNALWGSSSDPGGNVVTPNAFSNVTTVIAPPCE
jgi:Periplasmic copper-binding protein (NosD)